MSRRERIFDPRGWRLWLPAKRRGALSLLFLLLISLPLLNGIIPFVTPYALDEKRPLARKPALELRRPFRFPAAYEAYYDDHFPFRTRWVYLNSLLSTALFQASPTANVVVGRNGWLFMGNINPYFDEIDYYRNLKPFTFAELRRWQAVLEERRDWLRRRGAFYLFAVAPNKSTIYPEFLPGWVRRAHSRSRLDQLLAHMDRYSTLKIVDLRPALRAAKQVRPAYFKSDSHWNDWGGYAAYAAIMRQLQRRFPAARPRPLDEFQVRRSAFASGDLALMLSLPGRFREDEWRLLPKAPLQARVIYRQGPEARKGHAAVSVHVRPGAELPPALLVHDSFAHFMKQFVSEDFSRVIYVMDWQMNFYPDIVAKEGVRVVIDEMVEYSLLSRLPLNPGPLRKAPPPGLSPR